MADYKLRFLRTNWEPKTGDKLELSILFNVLEDKHYGSIPEEIENTIKGYITIGISRTLQKSWGLEGINLEKALVEYAKQHIRAKLIDNDLQEDENLQLNVYNSPDKCPFNVIGKNYYKTFEYQISIPETTKTTEIEFRNTENYEWDVFISHASEDKDTVALPLCELLEENGLKVWLDQYQLSLGDSLREKLDEGLSKSRYGAVIISKYFFSKTWTLKELNALFSIDEIRGKTILPVWHNVDHEFVAGHSPLLADKIAVSTSTGLQNVADEIIQAISEQ